MSSSGDIHQMEPAEFLEHVHSFEFWFGAVQGYLDGLHYGHRPETPDAELDEADRDQLITVLCNYCVGETMALEGAGALIRVAPNRPTKVFLSTQTVDEGRHLEVLIHRLCELGVREPEQEIARRASPALLTFKQRLEDFVRGEDWEAAVFAQNVCLEAMEFAAFHMHARTADPRTRELLLGIIKDERRHIGFGENELGRRIKQEPRIRQRLARVRQELDPLILESFRLTLDRVEARPDDHAELGRSYLDAVGEAWVRMNLEPEKAPEAAGSEADGPRQRFELDDRGFDEVPPKYRRFYRRWDGDGDELAPNEVLCPVCKVVIRSPRELRPGDRVYCMACMARLRVVRAENGRLEAHVEY